MRHKKEEEKRNLCYKRITCFVLLIYYEVANDQRHNFPYILLTPFNHFICISSQNVKFQRPLND